SGYRLIIFCTNAIAASENRGFVLLITYSMLSTDHSPRSTISPRFIGPRFSSLECSCRLIHCGQSTVVRGRQPYRLRIQLSGNHIQATHSQNGVGNIGPLNHFGVCLIVNKTRSSEMQTERCSSAVADQIESEFAITTLYAVIYFAFRHIGFAHHDFEMVNERLHIIVYILLRREIKVRNVRREG